MSRKTVFEKDGWKLAIDHDAEDRMRMQAAQARLRRQIEGPCPRCGCAELMVYADNDPYGCGELARFGMMEGEADYVTRVDRLIYCPKCGAIHEVGGETHYPQSGITGGPKGVDGGD